MIGTVSAVDEEEKSHGEAGKKKKDEKKARFDGWRMSFWSRKAVAALVCS
jgi:hypothetical protein